MGLDMYLEKEHYIGAQFEHRNVNGTVHISVYNKKIPITFNRISTIREQIGYWRKANAIHKWFVDKCQNGKDECQDTYVSYEDLETLLEICKDIKEHPEKASELLPSQNGFFFGSTEYDDWYFQDIDNTIKILENALSEPDAKKVDFYYRSSW